MMSDVTLTVRNASWTNDS